MVDERLDRLGLCGCGFRVVFFFYVYFGGVVLVLERRGLVEFIVLLVSGWGRLVFDGYVDFGG